MKKIEVVLYDPSWAEQFRLEAAQIKGALKGNCVAVHHVGSTSVPGLLAKPKIDILAVVKNPEEAIEPLQTVGYEFRGEYNIPLHYCFSKREGRSVNLHVYQEGHPEIELNLMFRDTLRSDSKLCGEYAKLKAELVKKKESHEKVGPLFSGYNLGKDRFITAVLKEAGFNRLRLVFCTHYKEWEAANRLRPNASSFDQKGHIHFALYKGVEVVGYAHIQLLSNQDGIIRVIVIDEAFRKNGYARQCIEWIEDWFRVKGYRHLYAEASLQTIGFYERLGYSKMDFEDPEGHKRDPRDIQVGKCL